MNLGKKILGVFICVLLILGVVLTYNILVEYDIFGQQSLEGNRIYANTEILNELVERQEVNGSWNNDFDTTVIAANTMTQSVELMQEVNDQIDWRINATQSETMLNVNEQAARAAENWALSNYNSDLPLITQNHISLGITNMCLRLKLKQSY